MSIDLKNLSVDPDNQKAELTLIHPVDRQPLTDEEGNEAVIILYGPDSTQLKTYNRKMLNRRARDGFKKGNFSFSADEVEKIRIERSMVATADWRNIGFEGQELECTEENKKKVYEAAPWIVEQIYEFIDDRANFFKS